MVDNPGIELIYGRLSVHDQDLEVMSLPAVLQVLEAKACTTWGEYATVCDFDLAPATKDVEHADHDWPAKKSALDERLQALRDIPKQAETQWKATEAVREAVEEAHRRVAELVVLELLCAFLCRSSHSFFPVQDRTVECVLIYRV